MIIKDIIGLLTEDASTQSIKASGTILIKSGGSFIRYPSSTLVLQPDGPDTYHVLAVKGKMAISDAINPGDQCKMTGSNIESADGNWSLIP